jgi:transcriptional regulator with PAS, ATPase and Fis domain
MTTHAARRDADHRHDLVAGNSPKMQAVFETLRGAAASRSAILLTGESGVGKEVLARAVHAWSGRAAGPFVAVNCAALTPSLLESELFGHERGAFTGAIGQKRGRFELAQAGTLFMDEIGELDARLQAKLLRALQEKEFQRVGGTCDVRVDARVVVATNRDLKAAIAERAFRKDLYYRIAVVSVRVPPLRERREDIRPLAEHLLDRFAQEVGRVDLRLGDDALAALEAHPWPGNVRELSNAIERAVALARGPFLDADDLGLDAAGVPSSVARPDPLHALPLADAVEAYKARRVQQALRAANGNQTRAAELLGMHQSNLSRLMRSLGMRPTKLDG